MIDRPVVLCDVMDTLVYNPFNAEIPAFFGMTQDELLEQKHPSAWGEFECGQIEEAEYLQRCFADGRLFDHAAFTQTVSQAYRWMDGAEELLRRLKDRGCEIHALLELPHLVSNDRVKTQPLTIPGMDLCILPYGRAKTGSGGLRGSRPGAQPSAAVRACSLMTAWRIVKRQSASACGPSTFRMHRRSGWQ